MDTETNKILQLSEHTALDVFVPEKDLAAQLVVEPCGGQDQHKDRGVLQKQRALASRGANASSPLKNLTHSRADLAIQLNKSSLALFGPKMVPALEKARSNAAVLPGTPRRSRAAAAKSGYRVCLFFHKANGRSPRRSAVPP